MKTLKAISVLMDYPSEAAQAHADSLIALFQADESLTPETRQGLTALVRRLRDSDLLDLQADYSALFDRSRALSLYLFEHLHGESRDRGQAMVELINFYQEEGLVIDSRELPDYVPLFLEFCSRLERPAALSWLMEAHYLLQKLHGRLQERECDYQWLFKALLDTAGLETADEQMQRQLQQEERDDTAEALDRVWAEEPVTFGPTAGGCGAPKTNQGQAVPVNWANLSRNSA
ncbi:nitrate reductase molybdenum cofactor assembly chaperone [Alkalilimnicola ehrlichii MLHE-1]|uniref:Respiratory nitrate reductase chaperone NarJ n=1 Tax=Alkalilimnicola ehrlichii (strain ATCC BAA-1101 / DSM 17681 / MLHE-1) TaxID=187272 RepID=Q0A9Y3_ALKEH|nr:nitrate reductase molybdenum cofactor assembly chaperone [Alkalilimnicola ehrlichii]ABI56354.1 respiratory nitrate reductase chaperone NarJ [Alkalilimnicola ehrlichii MLHE-1]